MSAFISLRSYSGQNDTVGDRRVLVWRGLIRFDEVMPIVGPGGTHIWEPGLRRKRWPLRQGRPGRSARRLLLAGLLTFLSVLAGCAITDEGAADFGSGDISLRTRSARFATPSFW